MIEPILRMLLVVAVFGVLFYLLIPKSRTTYIKDKIEEHSYQTRFYFVMDNHERVNVTADEYLSFNVGDPYPAIKTNKI